MMTPPGEDSAMHASTALVTGASRGIGRAIALRLSRDYRVIVLARDRTRLDEVAGIIRERGGTCEVVVADLASADSISRALAGCDANVLINNAGVIGNKPFLELMPHEWHEMVDVNLNALYHVTRAVLPAMLARGAGHVINIASIAGRSAFIGGTCYAATKHAVLGFSECLMLETREMGVKVSVIMPGSVATDPESGPDRDWRLTPEDVAHAVADVLAMPKHVLIYQVEVRAANPRKTR
jgi:short-subunit dehydrogenase